MKQQSTSHSGYEQYKKELASDAYKPLSKDQERAYFAEYKVGSTSAFQRLVKAHLRFTFWMLREYQIPTTVDVMDIIQEANDGLMEGIKRFNPTDYNCRMYTYCFYWIRFYIIRALAAQQKVSKVFVPIPDDADYVDDDSVGEAYADHEQVAKDIVLHALADVTKKERAILTLFFGLTPPYEPKTLQEIGSVLHMQLESVRKVKNTALEKLKKANLASYF